MRFEEVAHIYLSIYKAIMVKYRINIQQLTRSRLGSIDPPQVLSVMCEEPTRRIFTGQDFTGYIARHTYPGSIILSIGGGKVSIVRHHNVLATDSIRHIFGKKIEEVRFHKYTISIFDPIGIHPASIRIFTYMITDVSQSVTSDEGGR